MSYKSLYNFVCLYTHNTHMYAFLYLSYRTIQKVATGTAKTRKRGAGSAAGTAVAAGTAKKVKESTVAKAKEEVIEILSSDDED